MDESPIYPASRAGICTSPSWTSIDEGMADMEPEQRLTIRSRQQGAPVATMKRSQTQHQSQSPADANPVGASSSSPNTKAALQPVSASVDVGPSGGLTLPSAQADDPKILSDAGRTGGTLAPGESEEEPEGDDEEDDEDDEQDEDEDEEEYENEEYEEEEYEDEEYENEEYEEEEEEEEEQEAEEGEEDKPEPVAFIRSRISPLGGQGQFAAKDIDYQTLIISEASLLVVDTKQFPNQHDFLEQVRESSDDSKQTLLHLGAHGPAGVRGLISTVQELDSAVKHQKPMATHYLAAIFWHSCYPFKKGHDTYRLFEWASFFNHSCKPNAEASWDPLSKRLNIRALEAIEEGDEVTISYVCPYMTWEARRKQLGFFCHCELCLHLGELAEGEAETDPREMRLKRLAEGLEKLKAWRSRMFREDGFDGMNALDEHETAQEVMADQETETIIAEADALLAVAKEDGLWQSALSILFEVKYLVYMSMRRTAEYDVDEDDDEEYEEYEDEDDHKDHALQAKGKQFELLGQCLGLMHPQTQLALKGCQELVEKDDETLQKEVDDLAEVDIDYELRRGKKRC